MTVWTKLRATLPRALGGRRDSLTSRFPLQELYEREIMRHLDPWPHLVNLIVEKAEAQGVPITKRMRRRIETAVGDGEDDFDLQLRTGGWKWWEREKKSLEITLSTEDSDAIIAKLDQMLERLPDATYEVLTATAPALLEGWRQSYRPYLRRAVRERRAFEGEIAKLWGEPFESLALLIEMAHSSNLVVGDVYAEKAPAEPRLVEVLSRLHTRAVHVAREILTLLRGGYADGAMARWRTLHEIAVVSSFLTEHGEHCAQRYLDHNAVESLKAANQYQESAERLGFQPIPPEELAEVRAARDAALAQYGPAFDEDYGWAAAALQNRRPKFTDIERSVGLSHLRPFYKMASQNVHANPKGVLFKLGSPEPGLILIGPSPYGLADPGQNTAISLAAVIAHLGRICPVLDVVMGAQMALLLSDETIAKFIAVHRSLETSDE